LSLFFEFEVMSEKLWHKKTRDQIFQCPFPQIVESFLHPFPPREKGTSKFDAQLSFCHTIFDIYVSKAFQWYKECLI